MDMIINIFVPFYLFDSFIFMFFKLIYNFVTFAGIIL